MFWTSILDALFKELDFRIFKIEKDKMANETWLVNSEGDMEFETSSKDVVNKTAIGNDQNSLKQLNILERIIFEQSVFEVGERWSKNVLVFGVRKSKMSYDEQRKDDELALNEIINELDKVYIFFSL